MDANKIYVVGSYLVAMVMDTGRIPTKGETLMAANFRTAHGGKGSNQAVQAARLEGAVNFIGRIGNDNFGAAFKALLKTEKVGDEFVFVSNDLPTGAGFIICAADGCSADFCSSAAEPLTTKPQQNKDATTTSAHAPERIMTWSRDQMPKVMRVPVVVVSTLPGNCRCASVVKFKPLQCMGISTSGLSLPISLTTCVR